MDSPFPPQVPHQLAIDDAEVEPELVAHLVSPLDLERGRADDQNSPRAVADDQFEGDQPRFDGLAQTDIVRHQQVDPWHLDGPHHGVELIVFDVDAGSERGLNVLQIGGRRGPPADGVEESVEPIRGVEPDRVGQRHPIDDFDPRLNLPDDLDLFAESVVFNGQEGDEVLGLCRNRLQC